MSLETRDQAYVDGTEMEAAVEYAHIADDHDLPVTLFVTGKALREEPERARTLAAMNNVELGGHNYYAFSTPVHKLWRGLTGSWNGPRPFQAWEIRRTLTAFEEVGVDVRSWRDHAYRHDSNTAELLARYGVTHFSDAVEPGGEPREEDGVRVLPINTPPDHDHVYHSFRTPAFVAESDFEGPFGADAVSPDEWVDWVLECVDNVETATVLAHPACMQLADGFEAFEALCERLGKYETAPIALADRKP
ncbi:hypothetical protein ACFPYI_07325 [Halomarina salina]|uniref:Polysaccharide deacetylase n=1 Tax=Halomarina salina TaxID=1872699 RepID=A0ABD5RKG2_9EURY|nr:hypothetical protein [Halomarina salina]